MNTNATLRVKFAAPEIAITHYHIAHYHIQWSSESLDWQRFDSCVDADECANELVLSDETYTVEGFGADCPRCRSARASR
jgi:hypothetical protein